MKSPAVEARLAKPCAKKSPATEKLELRGKSMCYTFLNPPFFESLLCAVDSGKRPDELSDPRSNMEWGGKGKEKHLYDFGLCFHQAK